MALSCRPGAISSATRSCRVGWDVGGSSSSHTPQSVSSCIFPMPGRSLGFRVWKTTTGGAREGEGQLLAQCCSVFRSPTWPCGDLADLTAPCKGPARRDKGGANVDRTATRISSHLYERLILRLRPVLALCVEVVHRLAQEVGLVGVCQAGTGVLDLLGVVAVQLLHV